LRGGRSFTPRGDFLLGGNFPAVTEIPMKNALWNVVTDLKLMVLIVVLSQVIAIAQAVV